MGAAIRFIASAPCAVAEHYRDKAGQDNAYGHNFRTYPFYCSVHDRILKVTYSIQFAFLLPLLLGQVQVEEHKHSGFGI
jgi:hypothetical protein